MGTGEATARARCGVHVHVRCAHLLVRFWNITDLNCSGHTGGVKLLSELTAVAASGWPSVCALCAPSRWLLQNVGCARRANNAATSRILLCFSIEHLLPCCTAWPAGGGLMSALRQQNCLTSKWFIKQSRQAKRSYMPGSCQATLKGSRCGSHVTGLFEDSTPC
jgi:hypothetical protein